ncbi:TAXI family TRAP transporter solute-binding subunit [Leucobacter komagatae]|uniref:TAXI family TRAP transporter solute-binding subunit n=1 Tax=Leucobacter komagatae TaxID=55969 RepID=UPI002482D00A|nr:TAXI family TRAP transporter solute-binding subunit [Leucobacter komagatae]
MRRGDGERRLSPRATSRALLGGLAALTLALSGCSAAANNAEQLVIAGGASTGIYYSYGGALAGELRGEGLDAVVATSGGSVDNLLRVGRGEAILGFAQADAAADAISGVGAFDVPLPVQGVARVYDEYVQVVVPEESPAEHIPDLAGLRVSVGEVNSGVTVISDRVLRAAGIDEGDFVPVRLGLDDSVAALARRRHRRVLLGGRRCRHPASRAVEDNPAADATDPAETVEKVNSGHAGVYRLSDFPVAPTERLNRSRR